MIFWINSPFDALPLEGGRPLRYELLAKALVGLGHEVVWWSSDFHHQRKERRAVEPIYRCDGYEVRLIPTLAYQSNVGWRRLRSHRRYALLWRAMALAALSERELLPPDAIIVSMPPLGLFDQAKRFRDEYGCKIIVDIQDAWPENFYYFIPSGLRFLLGKLLFHFHGIAGRAYTGADAITAVAEKYLRLAESYGAACPKKVFPLGGLLPDFTERADSFDQRLKLIYVGNLGASYDLKTMLDGVAELARDGVSVSLDVAGDGPCRRLVERAVAQAAGVIRFHGYLPGDDLSRLMHQCHVGIIPMADELLVAVPNKLVDYAGHGLAVVNGLSSEAKDLLEEFGCGLPYDIGNVDSFKRAVLRYYADRELVKLHRANSRRMAGERFDAAVISVAMAREIVRL